MIGLIFVIVIVIGFIFHFALTIAHFAGLLFALDEVHALGNGLLFRFGEQLPRFLGTFRFAVGLKVVGVSVIAFAATSRTLNHCRLTLIPWGARVVLRASRVISTFVHNRLLCFNFVLVRDRC